MCTRRLSTYRVQQADLQALDCQEGVPGAKVVAGTGRVENGAHHIPGFEGAADHVVDHSAELRACVTSPKISREDEKGSNGVACRSTDMGLIDDAGCLWQKARF